MCRILNRSEKRWRKRQRILFTKKSMSCIINLVYEKRNDEESTHIQAFQRTSPQGTAAERDEARGMW